MTTIDLLSVKQVAERLGLTQRTIRGYVNGGSIRAVRLPGGYWRIPATEIERLLKPLERGADDA
jgi:excisionase family DNA binding protein